MWLAFHLGTSGVKAVVLDKDGEDRPQRGSCSPVNMRFGIASRVRHADAHARGATAQTPANEQFVSQLRQFGQYWSAGNFDAITWNHVRKNVSHSGMGAR